MKHLFDLGRVFGWLLVGTLSLPGAQAQQQRPVAFPAGNMSGSRGNWGPLGEACNGLVAEARTHILIPAEYLPARAGPISGLDHIPVWLTSSTISNCPTGMTTVQYARLDVTLAHRPRGAGPLSLTFANNLPAPPPAPVRSGSWTKTWTNWTWDTVPFQQPFIYNGTDDIVVEIRKVVTPTGQNVGTLRNLQPQRAGQPRQVMQAGGVGSGASNAAVGFNTNVFGWRLRFDNSREPTLLVRSPIGLRNRHFACDTTINYRIFDTSGDLYVLMVSFGFLPAPVPVPPVTGGLWLRSPIVLSSGIVTHAPGTSYHRYNFTIPVQPCVSGLQLAGQAATITPGTATASLTNAVDFAIP